MSDVKQQAITHVLQQDSAILSALLAKIARLKALTVIVQSLLPSKLVNHCEVVNDTDHHLVLVTHSAIWATQIRFQIPQLLVALKLRKEGEGVQRITCKLVPSTKAAEKESRMPPMKPLSREIALQVEMSAENIQHGRLKAVMLRIAGNSKK